MKIKLPTPPPPLFSMKKSLSAIIILTIFLITPKKTLAQELTTTASPPRLELEAQPGNTLQETLKITNSSNTPQTYTVTATDFIVNDQDGTPIAVTDTVSGRWSLSSWLITTPKNITIKPKQSALVILQVTVPQDALAGGHYAMVTYQPVTPDELNLTGSAIAQKVGTLIYLKVQGDITEAAFLKDFSVPKKWFEYGPIDITTTIENQGDIHLRPTGQFKVTNLLGKTILANNLTETNIFPFATRTHTFQLPNKYYLGKYKAELNAYAGSSTLPITGVIYFWVIPYKEILITLATIIIIIIIFSLKHHKPQSLPPNTPSVPTESPETTPPTA